MVPNRVSSGFVVHSFIQQSRRGDTANMRVCLLGRFADGSTFAVVDDRISAGFYVTASDLENALQKAGSTPFVTSDENYRTIYGEEVAFLSWDSSRTLLAARNRLEHHGMRTFEADVSTAERYLMDHHLHGMITVTGESNPGHHVDHIFKNPELSPCEEEPALVVSSMDIETDPDSQEITTIAICTENPFDLVRREEILFQRKGAPALAPSPVPVRVFSSERDLLSGWIETVNEHDPDIITGWNVVDFDLRMISRRLQANALPFAIGRSTEHARFLDGGKQGSPRSHVYIPGRQAVDAMTVARRGPQRFENYSLETVAAAVTGEGKSIGSSSVSEKLETIRNLYRHDPQALCRYCHNDAVLVQRILDHTGLLRLTLKRVTLIGIPLSRAWTSIAAFEFTYIEAMHRRGLVAPTLGVDTLPSGAAPGGAILEPAPGLHRNVLVFDFKSLYPSIIRTFNIDPVARARETTRRRAGADVAHKTDGTGPMHDEAATQREGREATDEPICAPGGACFSREPGILPEILSEFFVRRAEAQAAGDSVASYVYKIIMNSFYGVLGSPGCRFAGAELAGAITGFGQALLHWCRDLLTSKGYRVIYGDTDSLFVLSALPAHTAPAALHSLGATLCEEVNSALADHIRQQYRLTSRLELEFEKAYDGFFLPAVRGRVTGEAVRGRAKGYAGRLAPADPAGNAEVEVVGMEAVRRDWTDLAGMFQRTLLQMLFDSVPADTVTEYVHRLLRELRSGAFDEELVYRKQLTKPVSDYARGRPPHVQAALKLPAAERSGIIEYVMTTRGPQPRSVMDDNIDYQHYIEKQLRPVYESIAEAFVTEVPDPFDENPQMTLFS